MKVKNAAIAVESIEESSKFYTDILGMKEVRRFSPQPGLTIAFIQGEGEAMIELIEGESGKKGLYLIGMEVEDMDSEISKLENNGVTLTRGPIRTPGSPVIAFFEGPNGEEIELIENKD